MGADVEKRLHLMWLGLKSISAAKSFVTVQMALTVSTAVWTSLPVWSDVMSSTYGRETTVSDPGPPLRTGAYTAPPQQPTQIGCPDAQHANPSSNF